MPGSINRFGQERIRKKIWARTQKGINATDEQEKEKRRER